MYQPIFRRLGPLSVQAVLPRASSRLPQLSHQPGRLLSLSHSQILSRYSTPTRTPIAATAQQHVRCFNSRPLLAQDPVLSPFAPITTPRKPRQIFRKLLYLLGGLGLTGYAVDRFYLGSVGMRSTRAYGTMALVHYARLPDGREVAIKVQRRQIAAQMSSDLSTLRRMIEFTAKQTSIPMASLGDFLMNHVMQETDFEHERSNSECLAEFVREDPRLCDRVHIPVVYGDLSSKRVLTTEWIHGVTLWDKDSIAAANTPAGRGLGLDLGDVMETVIELFSAQMFRYGFVHCDPHPGNIFVRRLPSGKPEIVLLDHGLYITLSESLRQQYAQFWKGLLTQDTGTLRKVSNAWGMEDPEPWADAFTMSSKKLDKARSDETPEERDERIIAETAGYFGTDGVWPPELVFLERNLGLVQGSNRFLGSPVNRVKLIGVAAMRSVEASGQENMWTRVRSRWSLFMLDLGFYLSSVRQYFGYGGGFEEDLKEEEDKATRELKDTLAVVLGIAID